MRILSYVPLVCFYYENSIIDKIEVFSNMQQEESLSFKDFIYKDAEKEILLIIVLVIFLIWVYHLIKD